MHVATYCIYSDELELALIFFLFCLFIITSMNYTYPEVHQSSQFYSPDRGDQKWHSNAGSVNFHWVGKMESY